MGVDLAPPYNSLPLLCDKALLSAPASLPYLDPALFKALFSLNMAVNVYV